MNSKIGKQRFIKASVSAALVASSISAVVTPAAASTFTDLTTENSHYENIINLLERGIVKGFPDGTYRPNTPVTRGQAAKIIAGVLNLNTTDVSNPNFTDVATTHQYYPYIAALVQAGIISGYSDKTFKPGQTITRGQMAKMIALGFQLKGEGSTPFTDVPANHQYADYVAALFASNVTTGKTENTFDLAGFVTRGQLASFVVRAENVNASSTTVSGTISAVSKDGITVNGTLYKTATSAAFLTATSNSAALLNANVTFTATNNEITAVSSLELKNGSSFDAQNATITELTLPASITALKNVQATTITLSVGAKTTVDNVKASTFNAKANTAPVASLAVDVPSIDLVFNGSTIDILNILGSIAAVQKTASTITTLHAENVANLLLNGDFKNVHVSPSTAVKGTAIVEFLHFAQALQKDFKPDAAVQIKNVIVNGQSYTWDAAVSQFLTKPTSSGGGSSSSSSNTNNNSSSDKNDDRDEDDKSSNEAEKPVINDKDEQDGPVIDDKDEQDKPIIDGEDEQDKPIIDGEDDQDKPIIDGEDDQDKPIIPNQDPTKPTELLKENISISEDFTVITGRTATQDVGSIVYIYNEQKDQIGEATVNADGSFEVVLTSGDSSIITVREDDLLTIVVEKDTKSPGTNRDTRTELIWTVTANKKEQPPLTTGTVTTESLNIEDNMVQLTNGEETVSYEVTDRNILSFLTANISSLENVQMDITNDEVTAITAATITNADQFDGNTLHDVQIDTLTVTDATAVQNIQTVNNLIVESAASTLAFSNVSANITATGSFESISGASGEQLTIASTVANVVVSNVTSKNIIIDESTKIAQTLAGKRIASTLDDFVFAAETKMAIAFKDGDYSGQTLTINRKDTIVDIEGTPFTEISIKNDNVDLKTNGKEINRLVVAKNVTYLNLDANVETFTVELAQALIIHSTPSVSASIDELVVTAPLSGTDGWLEFVNVTPTKVTLNDVDITPTGSTTDHAIFKKQIVNGVSTFSSALVRSLFGLYNFNSEKTITHYALVKDSTKLNDYKNATTLPSDAQLYDATKPFVLYADVEYVVAYTANGTNVTGVSVAEAPSNLSLVRLDRKTANGDLTYFTRFADDQSPSETLKTIYIFKNGTLSKATNVTGSWTKLENGINSITVNTGVTLTNTREIILGNNILSVYGADVTTYENDYVKILKKVAELSKDTNNTNLMKEMLDFVFSKTEGEYNNFFLTKYIDAIIANPSSLTSLADFENLIATIDTTNAYDKTATKTATDLYLKGTIENNFTYSTDGIITNSVNDNGDLLFTANNAGTTTVRVTDSTGLSTLVHVAVDADKKITTTVLAKQAPVGTLIEGAENFRYDGTTLIAKAFTKENGSLKNASAIIQENDSTDALTRLTLVTDSSSYTLSDATPIAPVKLAPIEFGMDSITTVTGQNVGFKVLSSTEVMFYPRFEGTELIFVGNGEKEVAVNATSNTTIENLAGSIARSNILAIGTDLNLLAVNEHTFLGTAPKNVFLHKDPTSIRVFAKDAFVGSVKLIDGSNTVTIVNVTSTKAANKVTVQQDLKAVKTTLAGDANTLTVQHIDTPIVRANGLDLYAIGAGSATVTLSDGTQYLVKVDGTGNVYTIEEEVVQNLNITAAELHMTDIKEVLGAGTVQYVKNNSEAIISLATNSEAVVTLLSTNNEKAVIKVTKDANGYKYEPYRSVLDATTLKLTEIKEVFNTGNTPTITYARANVGLDKDSNTNKLYIYNLAAGNQTFRVTNGAAESTAINVKVTADGNGFVSTPVAVTHPIPTEYDLADNAKITSTAARLDGRTIYATGLDLTNNKATIEVPLKNGANYVINLNYDPDTGLSKFDNAGTVTFTLNYTKEELGLDTVTAATTAGSNILPTVVDGKLNIAVTGDTDSRIEVTGTVDNQTAKTFIYVKRTGGTITKNIERAEKNIIVTETDENGNPVETTKTVALDLNLKDYGYTTTPTGSWTVANVARATISADFKANFYALNAGSTGFKLTDQNNQALLINVTADANNPRALTATVVEEKLSEDLSVTGTIIEGDGVRLSADETTVYATKVGATAKVKLSNGSYMLYEVTQNDAGQFKLTPTPLTNIKVVTADELGLTGNITATNLNTTIVAKTEDANSIVLTALQDGKTAMLVTDSNGATALVNIEVNGTTVTTTKVDPVPVDATLAPTLLSNEPTSVVRIEDKTIHPLAAGTVRLLVDNEIQELTVSSTDGHFAITPLTLISKAVYSKADLGFTENAAIEFETPANANFYVGELQDKVVAYSKLTGNTTGSYEFVVKATDTEARTLIRLNDKGTALLEQQVAKKSDVTFDNATTVTFNQPDLARFDAAKDILYLFKEGSTFVTANNRLHAVDITRDAEGYLTAGVNQLIINGDGSKFSSITGTDNAIIDVTEDAIYAKAIGSTKVKLGNDILTITIGKDATGKYTMEKAVTTSQFVPISDTHLTDFATVEVIAGTANSVSLSKDATGLTIFSNGATTAQSLLIRVTDATNNKAVINVTLDETGAVSEAKVVSKKVENLKIPVTAAETVKTDYAQAVWNGTTLTVYPLKAGNSTLEFANGLINVSTTADGNKLNEPTVTLISHDFTNMDVITNGAMINEHYFTAQGTGLVYTNNEVFSFGITKENNQYVKTISSGSPAATFDLTAIGGTFAEDKATLNTVKVVKDQVKANTDPEKLVIYTTGEGVSELIITQADGPVVYQVKSTATKVETPQLADASLTPEFTGASVKAGDSLRLAGNTVYFLKEGTTALLKDNKLVNATVTRDADGFFTATPAFVTATIKEKATNLTNFAVENDTTLVALNDAATETFYTENYRVTATTTEENNFYTLAVDERHMNTFNVGDYFAISDTVTVKATSGNTNANAVLAEVVNGKLIIYAGETAGNALITFTNGTKEVVFNAIHGLDGTILATPQAAVDSLKFEDIGLSTTTHAITVENIFDEEVAEVTATATGLNVNAKKAGTTSVALKQNGSIVGFVNIKIESVNSNYKITSTPVTYEVSETELFTTALTAPRSHDIKLYPTAIGKTLYGTGSNATSVVVTQNATTGLYSATKNTHTLAVYEASALDLDNITHVSVNGSTVEAAYSSDNSKLYIYGLNNGTSEVVASNATQYAKIVAKNGATLVPEIARTQLDAADFPTATWTTNFVQMRGGYIYATHAGTGIAEADLGSYKAFMNINVASKVDHTFDISYDIVDHVFDHNVTVLTGTSIKADGTRIFAQQAGTSTIEVDTKVYTVTVEEMTDGSYKLTVSEPVETIGITATELGLTTITKTNIAVITGAGVVETPIIKDDTTPSNSKVVLQPKYAGEAQVTITDGTNSTIVHVLVENQNGELVLTPTIAKKDLDTAPKQEELTAIQTGNTFRVVGSTLFALKDGTVIAPIQGELHKLTAKKINNALLPTFEKITATLPGTVNVPTNSTILKANGNDVIAIGFGTELVTVDGTRSFRVTVNNDGSIVLEELLAKTVDLTSILNSVTNELTTESAVATIKYNETTATIDPKIAGTETMTISDGTNSVQIKVTVTDNNGTLSVVTEIPSAKLRTGTVGFYPTGITMPNGSAFTSKHGVIKLADGEITVYPGERSADSKAVTTQVIVKGANKTALYELKINEDHSYSFAPFVQTVGYDAFKFKPEIFQKIGNSYAQIGETGLDISFDDTNETIFIVKGDTNTDYKVLSVQANIDTAANSFAAKTPEVYTAHTVVGDITNVNGLYVAKDGDTSIIFADSNTQFPASYTHNGIIYNVTKNDNVTEANKNQLVVTTLTVAQTPETAATSARFIHGTDVAAIEVVDGATKWAIKTSGTGIYKINDTDYVTIQVDASDNTYTLTKGDAMQTLALEATATNAQVISPLENVYVDGNTVFGTSTKKIIVSAEKDGGKVIYTGKFATPTDAAISLTVSKQLLSGEKDGETGLLGWTAFESSSLNPNSSILRIEDNEIYALGVGEETITFTSKNGLKRTVHFEVTNDYQLHFTPIDENIVTYTLVEGDGTREVLFTFTMNVSTDTEIEKVDTVSEVSIYGKEINIGFEPGIEAVNTFTIAFPELSSTPIEFTITITDVTTVIISSSNSSLKFNKITE